MTRLVQGVYVTAVPGTWGYQGIDQRNGQWWIPGSLWFYTLASYAPSILPLYDQPFVWSTDVNGALDQLFRCFTKRKHTDWQAGGASLSYYLRFAPLPARNVVAHSHGGQVVAYACAAGTPINNLITVGTPVRKDMDDIWQRALPNIRGRWMHIQDQDRDWMSGLGQLFDGRLGWQHKMPWADQNMLIPDIDHSKLLHDEATINTYWPQLHRWLCQWPRMR